MKTPEILANDPVRISRLGFRQQQGPTAPTDEAAISHVQHQGRSLVLSRFGDPTWDLSPFIKNANLAPSSRQIVWPDISNALVTAIKTVCLRFWKHGRDGSVRPTATTVIGLASSLSSFAGWLDGIGVTSLSDVTRFHLFAYVQHCRNSVRASSVVAKLLAVETCWALLGPDENGLRDHPWPGESACQLSGFTGTDRSEAKTLAIPEDICRHVFSFSESLISQADEIIANNQNVLFPTTDWVLLRSAIYFRLGIGTGMRNHELVSIEINCCSQIMFSGVSTTWISGTSLKTHVGPTSWQAPAESARLVDILTRMSAMHRRWICIRIKEIESAVAKDDLDDQEAASQIKTLFRLKQDKNRLFLGFASRNSSVQVPNLGRWRELLQDLFNKSGCDWRFQTHQLRRTFAVYVAGHSLGDLRYLRRHFKHISLDMTALYATHVRLDHQLMDEINVSYKDAKTAIISDFLSEDVLISGGAAGSLRDFRKGQSIQIFDSRQALVSSIEPTVRIRGTGHGYCLSSRSGCGGEAPNEATRCAGCSNSIITREHSDVWRELYCHTRELLALPDLSAQEVSRLQRDLKEMASVISDLTPPKGDVSVGAGHE